MRILLASKYGPHGRHPIGGVQTWVATVADQLIQDGHHVTMLEAGQKPRRHKTFDLGFISNWPKTQLFAPYCDRKLQISHGIIRDEEPAVGRVVYTSEEIRDYWKVPGAVIRQPIDLEFWSTRVRSRQYLVWHSYRSPLPLARNLARRLALEFRQVKGMEPRGVRDLLRQAALVLASGRAALEAMACEAPTLICDHRSAYQGPLYDPGTRGAMTRNYSGRGGKVPVEEELYLAAIRAMGSPSLRSHVVRHHKRSRIVQQLIREIMK